MDASENFVKIPLEYWSDQNAWFLQPLENYVIDLLGKEFGKIYIDTSTYFDDDFHHVMENTVLLDLELYLKADQILRERHNNLHDSLHLAYVVLLLNEEIDFFEFINNEALSDLEGGNYWIRSNETIFIWNQVAILFLIVDKLTSE
jgi:hypothetical protein